MEKVKNDIFIEKTAYLFEMEDKTEYTNKQLHKEMLYKSIEELAILYNRESVQAAKFFKNTRRKNYEDKDGDKYTHDNKEYGITGRLNHELNFDLEPKESDSLKERTDKLKLMKLICVTMKFGIYEGTLQDAIPKNKEYIAHYPKFDLIKVITNPRLIYVGNDYVKDCNIQPEVFDFTEDNSNKKVDSLEQKTPRHKPNYPKIRKAFETVLKKVREQIPNADEIENELFTLHDNWKTILKSVKYDSIFNSLEETQRKEESIKKTWKRITSFPVNVCDLIPISKNEKSQTGVMEQFFIMLICTKIKSEIADYCRIRFFTNKEIQHLRKTSIEKNEIETFPNVNLNEEVSLKSNKKNEAVEIILERCFENDEPEFDIKDSYANDEFYNESCNGKDFFDMIYKKASESAADDDKKEKAWKLILMEKTPSQYSIELVKSFFFNTYYKRTVFKNNAQHLANLLNENKDEFPEASIGDWCVIFRELMYIMLYDENIENTPSESTNKYKTVSSIVSNYNPANFNSEPFPIIALKERLIDRRFKIFTSVETTDKRREIQKRILNIEESILSYHTMNSIRTADRILFFTASLNSEGEEIIELNKFFSNYNLGNGFTIKYNDETLRRDFISAMIRDAEYTGSMQNEEYNEIIREFLTPEVTKEALILAHGFRINENEYKHMKIVELTQKIKKLKILESAENKFVHQLTEQIEKISSTEDIGYYEKIITLNLINKKKYECNIRYSISREEKIITITECTFENNIQKILDMRTNTPD